MFSSLGVSRPDNGGRGASADNPSEPLIQLADQNQVGV